MLKVLSVIGPEPGRVLIKPPDPFMFQVEGSSRYTWAALSPDLRQFLAIGVDPESGVVREVLLHHPGQTIDREMRRITMDDWATPGRPVINLPYVYANLTAVAGLPVVDVSEFRAITGTPSPAVTESCDIKMTGDGRSLYIILNDAVVPDRLIRCDRFGFYVGSGYLCGLAFFDLTPDEYSTICESGDRHLKSEM
jgi:hypothetical protein